MQLIGKKAQFALKNKIDSRKKNRVLEKYIHLIKKNRKIILKQNKKDIKNALEKKLKPNLINRLIINNKKINEICNSVSNIKKLKDPINVTLKNGKGLIIYLLVKFQYLLES